ncbi:hypothetical protein E3N88_26709 [Mikania micrantha]|uniref:Oxysterol-binding protein n=1 Tax=Mikania micrantha TaxID=192012 RepID=A0A5N6MUS6_9ASTR|nr:hypothetical protein E3N88_26709 [Mikania micrantha]
MAQNAGGGAAAGGMLDCSSSMCYCVVLSTVVILWIKTSIGCLLGYEGLEVINPEGGTEDAEVEAQRGRWKQEERDSYWRSMQKYVGADITSMVTLPVLIFEPMTMLQEMAELMEYSHLLELADKCEDPYMRLVHTASWFISVYYALQRTWKPFNPILGETYEMVNHCGITFIAEQVSHHPPISAAHAENEHFVYDITSKVKTKFLGNSLDLFYYVTCITRLKLKKDGVILDLVPPPTKVNNLIFGRTWIDSPEEMILTNLTTGDKVVLYFQPCGWFGVDRYEVDGLEEKQRAEKRIRESKGQDFVPKWFDQTDQTASTPWGDLEIYEYNDKYIEHRAAADNSGTVEEVDIITKTEFNPWQFGNVEETN